MKMTQIKMIERTSRASFTDILSEIPSDPLIDLRSCRLCLKLLIRKMVPTRTTTKQMRPGMENETSIDTKYMPALYFIKSKMTTVRLVKGEVVVDRPIAKHLGRLAAI